MVTLFGLFALLSALVAPSHSLACKQCTTVNGTSCTGESIDCPSNNLCGATYTIYTAGRVITRIYAMSCLHRDNCSVTGSASLHTRRNMKIATSCCNTANCTPSLPSFPPESSEQNGLTCRSCFSNSSGCHTSETTKCTGVQYNCILQTRKVTAGSTGAVLQSSASRGCATKSICDLRSQTYTEQNTTVDVKFICTNGSTGLQIGFYLPALICLFLMKLLL